MSDADKAYTAAKRAIAKAKNDGAESLKFGSGDFSALIELPAEIAGLDRLRLLELDATQITDLTPLAGMVGLNDLSLNNTRITDLTPLSGLVELSRLSLYNTGVTDLAPLAGMTAISSLALDSTGVSDLTPLAGMAGMSALSLDNTKIADLAPLAGIVEMRWLNLDDTGVTDLKPLEKMAEMQVLSLNRTRVSDLAPLAGMGRMGALYFSDTLVSDLAPLAWMVRMTVLSLDNTAVTDLTPLGRKVDMVSISLNNTAVTNIAPLARMEGLQRLSLSGTGVTDLAPLAELVGMTTLHLSDTEVTDLAPLAGMRQLVENPTLGGLQFAHCAAAKAHARIAEIAEIEDPSDRARSLFEYLKDRVPPEEVTVIAELPFAFFSYASPNRPQIAALRDFLVGQKVPIWWDQDIPAGARWRSDIEDQLAAAHAVVTFWTAESVASAAVIEEASTAQKNGRLVPVRLDDAVLPYGFGETQYIDLRGWDGTATHAQMRKLLQALQDRLNPPDAGEMAARLLAASPIAMLPKDGVLAPVDTPPNIYPEVVNAPDLAARVAGMQQNLAPLRNMAADRDNYQFPVDLGHALAAVHGALHAKTLSWYGINDARETLCDCMEEHDAKGYWNIVMFRGLERLTLRMAELRPLLQPRQVPADAPAAKPPEPDPVVRAADVAEVAKIATAAAAIAASAEGAAILDPTVIELVGREVERITEAAQTQDETRRFSRLRKSVQMLAYVTGGIISGVGIGVATNLLTAPEAAATLAKQLQPLFERLLAFFL